MLSAVMLLLVLLLLMLKVGWFAVPSVVASVHLVKEERGVRKRLTGVIGKLQGGRSARREVHQLRGVRVELHLGPCVRTC